LLKVGGQINEFVIMTNTNDMKIPPSTALIFAELFKNDGRSQEFANHTSTMSKARPMLIATQPPILIKLALGNAKRYLNRKSDTVKITSNNASAERYSAKLKMLPELGAFAGTRCKASHVIGHISISFGEYTKINAMVLMSRDAA
jgi:hypothetical protein